MSLYSHKNNKGGGVQPWSQVVTLAEAGKGCDGLFGLYDSLGDKTLTGANTIPTLLDGPEKVVRYGALTLGDGTMATSLTASSRCKGLVILCDSLLVKANATLNMTGRGARVFVNDDPMFPYVDYRIPFKVTLDSTRMTLAQALAVIKTQGLTPWDVGTFQHLVAALYGFNLGITLAGSVTVMAVSGLGLNVGGVYAAASTVNGLTGGAGANGCMGGGGSGASQQDSGGYSSASRPASPYCGGGGGGGSRNSGLLNALVYASSQLWNMGINDAYITLSGKGICGASASGYSGGGGAGVIPGMGTLNGAENASYSGGIGAGGKLTIICRGTITVQSGGKIEANGMVGGAATAAGGGSGGGHVSIISPAAPANSGTIQAAGGAGGAGASNTGGPGGAGSVVTKTFSDMGW